jgi:uncharacterized protein YecE (DUF72 family)
MSRLFFPCTGTLRCGTTGWSFNDWERLVYPRPQPRGFHPLEFLADRFECVEIHSTFERIPRPELTRLWAAKVARNPEFRFTVRAPRAFTYERNLADAPIFVEAMKSLDREGRLGAVLMQFPGAFRFTPENRDFLIRARRALHAVPLVAELRHVSWMHEEAIGTLVDYKVGFCNLDQPAAHRAAPPSSYLTTRIGYVKLHGRAEDPAYDSFDAPAAGTNHLYTTAELESWKPRVEHLQRFAEEVYVIFGNSASGRSVVNGLQMQSLMGGNAPAARKPQPMSPAGATLFEMPGRAA